MTPQELKSSVMMTLITTSFWEISGDTFRGIIFTREEQGQIIAMRYFSGNIFVILNMLGTAIQDLRTIIRPDTHDFMRDEANSHLDKTQTMFDEINQILNLFPKA